MAEYMVDSSNLRCVDYDPWSGTLVIEFHGGRIYEFYHVPQAVHAGLLHASSHGQFFHQRIKDQYADRRVA